MKTIKIDPAGKTSGERLLISRTNRTKFKVEKYRWHCLIVEGRETFERIYAEPREPRQTISQRLPKLSFDAFLRSYIKNSDNTKQKKSALMSASQTFQFSFSFVPQMSNERAATLKFHSVMHWRVGMLLALFLSRLLCLKQEEKQFPGRGNPFHCLHYENKSLSSGIKVEWSDSKVLMAAETCAALSCHQKLPSPTHNYHKAPCQPNEWKKSRQRKL